MLLALLALLSAVAASSSRGTSTLPAGMGPQKPAARRRLRIFQAMTRQTTPAMARGTATPTATLEPVLKCEDEPEALALLALLVDEAASEGMAVEMGVKVLEVWRLLLLLLLLLVLMLGRATAATEEEGTGMPANIVLVDDMIDVKVVVGSTVEEVVMTGMRLCPRKVERSWRGMIAVE